MLDQATERTTVPTMLRDGVFLEFYTEEFSPEPSSPESFRQQLIEWFFASKHLRRFEIMRLAGNPDPADLESHRRIVDALIVYGEFAANFARKAGVDLTPLGLIVECIEAETSLLKDSIIMYHERTMSPEKARIRLDEMFSKATAS